MLHLEHLAQLVAEGGLGEVRHRLIDLLTAAVDSALPSAKARMIQLEAKQAVSALVETLPADLLAGLDLIPLSIVVAPGTRPIVLAQDPLMVSQLEASADLPGPLASRVPFDRAGYRIVTRSVTAFLPDRLLYDCIAIRLSGPQKK